jgi:hypothetical protein
MCIAAPAASVAEGIARLGLWMRCHVAGARHFGSPQPPYLYRVMTQGGTAWALRAREVLCGRG